MMIVTWKKRAGRFKYLFRHEESGDKEVVRSQGDATQNCQYLDYLG